MSRLLGWMVLGLLALNACGCANQLDSDSVRAALTQRERDSLLARSGLPGAATVGRALEQTDAALDRAATLDSLTR